MLEIELHRNGAYIPSGADYQKIKRYFTIKTKTVNNFHITTCQCKMVKDFICVPRFEIFNILHDDKLKKKLKLKDHKVKNYITEGQDIPCNWLGSLRDNQPCVVNHIMQRYFNEQRAKKGKAGITLNLEAGQGKTFAAMGIINILKKKTLIVTHNTTIMFQWKKELIKLFPNCQIGLLYGKEKTDGDIIVSVVNSLASNVITYNSSHYFGIRQLIKKTAKLKFALAHIILEYTGDANIRTDDYFSRFGFIIYDESHEYCGKERAKILKKAQATYMLGLSATPNERSDRFDRVSHWWLGKVLDAKTIKGYSEETIPFKGRVKMVKYNGPPEYTETHIHETTGLVMLHKTMEQFINDPYRMRLIASYTRKMMEKKLNLFIFADRREYLSNIKKYLIENDILAEIMDTEQMYERIKRVVGGAKDEELKFAEQKCQIILTTYQFMGTGKSIPKMNAIMYVTPRKTKSKQFTGRIFRLGSNYDIERQIIDIVDWCTIVKNQWYKRKKYYDEKKYIIDVEEHNWETL